MQYRCQRFIVSGNVQGVFYRASTRDQARRLGLTGWVSNRDDGSVVLMACGEPDKLKALEQWCRRGPPAAKVDKVSVEPVEGSGYMDFSIR